MPTVARPSKLAWTDKVPKLKHMPRQKYRGHAPQLLCALLLGLGQWFCGEASATDSIYSETSHAIFGAVTGGAFTWGANYAWPEHRAIVGFSASVVLGVVGEAASKNGFSALDAGAHALGAAVGAAITDKFLLAPVIKRDVGHASTYIGVVLVKQF